MRDRIVYGSETSWTLKGYKTIKVTAIDMVFLRKVQEFTRLGRARNKTVIKLNIKLVLLVKVIMLPRSHA